MCDAVNTERRFVCSCERWCSRESIEIKLLGEMSVHSLCVRWGQPCVRVLNRRLGMAVVMVVVQASHNLLITEAGAADLSVAQFGPSLVAAVADCRCREALLSRSWSSAGVCAVTESGKDRE